MSVVVRGMEMPKCCANCELHRCEYDNYDVPYSYWCAAIEDDVEDAEHSCHKDCPLEPVIEKEPEHICTIRLTSSNNITG